MRASSQLFGKSGECKIKCTVVKFNNFMIVIYHEYLRIVEKNIPDLATDVLYHIACVRSPHGFITVKSQYGCSRCTSCVLTYLDVGKKSLRCRVGCTENISIIFVFNSIIKLLLVLAFTFVLLIII